MISPEKERVPLGKVAFIHLYFILLSRLYFVLIMCACFQGLKARGNVEEWLGKVEESMVNTLRKLTKYAISDYEEKTREEWVTCHPSQVR